jgi:hypothetical protein
VLSGYFPGSPPGIGVGAILDVPVRFTLPDRMAIQQKPEGPSFDRAERSARGGFVPSLGQSTYHVGSFAH